MTLTIDRDGERLDSALSRLVPELTRSQAQRLIEQGAVTLAGRPVKKNEKLWKFRKCAGGGAAHPAGGLL